MLICTALLLGGCSSDDVPTVRKNNLTLGCIDNTMYIVISTYNRAHQGTAQFLDFEGRPYTCERYCTDNPADCVVISKLEGK